MISKKLFTKILSQLDENIKKEQKFSKALEHLCDDEDYIYCYMFSKDNDLFIELLEEEFGFGPYGYSPISYFVYELDFGRKYAKGCYADVDGDDIDISTPEKLYDYCKKCWVDKNKKI